MRRVACKADEGTSDSRRNWVSPVVNDSANKNNKRTCTRSFSSVTPRDRRDIRCDSRESPGNLEIHAFAV